MTMASSYSRLPVNDPQARYAPRPHSSHATVPPPPKMNKDSFDRCGNCTRAFGFLSRKVSSSISHSPLTDRDIVGTVALYIVLIVVPKSSGWSSFRDTFREMSRSVTIARNSSKVSLPMECNLKVVDRMPAQVLITMSVRSLREYIEAYGIDKDMPFVEKTDLINAILSAQITEHNEEVISLKQLCSCLDI